MNVPANRRLFIGIDLGTSGIRVCAIDSERKIHSSHSVDLPTPPTMGARFEQHPTLWWEALTKSLHGLIENIPAKDVAAIAIDGTSGSILLSDNDGNPIGPALMYRDARATAEAALISKLAPPESAAHGPSSGLAKLLWLSNHTESSFDRVLNQADWIMGRLSGNYGISDENNCLKLGYDPIRRCWPEWIKDLSLEPRRLPRVYPIGQSQLSIDRDIADRFGLPDSTRIVTGTTDSIAALLATGARAPADAVTSLGSTLVLKVISTRPVFAPEYGIYSHRLGDLWLAGGASNSGGAVLRQYFTQQQLRAMTPELHPDRPTGLDYYPLTATGERFPQANPGLRPRLSPRPSDPVRFFQGMLEGIAEIEKQGYQKLWSLGAPYPRTVRSVGGGAANIAWTKIRQRRLEIDIISAEHPEAAYGAALLARYGIIGDSL
ncbi:MAG: FGGY-family carbohydrate kinase [Pseudomonadota bacterium]